MLSMQAAWTDLPRSCTLVGATMRTHRGAILAWAVGGTAVMVAISLALAEELANFPGGPQALAASLTPSAEAMRPLRWPAERLDTLGGYLSYHNLSLMSFFLGLYASVQGTRAIRRAEERNTLEQVLATGVTRSAVVGETTFGFALVLLVTSGLLGIGVAVALALGGEPNPAGSMIAMASIGLCAMACYSMGLVVSQFLRTSRGAAGVAGLILVALYLASTTVDADDAVGFVAWLSPFWWASKSRALVPGQGADAAAFGVMALSAVALAWLASYLFCRRDYQDTVWHFSRSHTVFGRMRVAGRADWALTSVWSATLLRSPVGLAAWMMAAAAFLSLMVGLSPAVVDIWEQSTFAAAMFTGPLTTASEQYLSFAVDLVGLIVVAYVIVQASGWVSDAQGRRLEMVLSTPRSAARVVLERVGAAATGALLVTIAGFVGLLLSASLVDVSVSWGGLLRATVMTITLGLAVAGIAALLVAWFKSGAAIGALGAIMTAMYLLGYLVPMLGWPEEVLWLSLFWAFDHPYLGWPTAAQFVVIAVAACVGTAAACRAVTPHCARA